MPEPVAFTFTVDGLRLPVFEDARGQYIIDDQGEEIRGVWFIAREECDLPIVVDQQPRPGG
jgi:hypothetical protein